MKYFLFKKLYTSTPPHSYFALLLSRYFNIGILIEKHLKSTESDLSSVVSCESCVDLWDLFSDPLRGPGPGAAKRGDGERKTERTDWPGARGLKERGGRTERTERPGAAKREDGGRRGQRGRRGPGPGASKREEGNDSGSITEEI